MSISVVIPAYNSEKTIARTIQSLLNQDSKVDEIIVVDDGSKDNTSKQAEKYPVKIIRKERGGEASSLNAGIKQAKGDYVAIVEADVILPQNWLSSLLPELKGDVIGAGAGLAAANPESLIARICGWELELRYQKIKEKFVSHITSANTLYKREVFEKVGFYDESLINASLDADLNARLIEKGYKLVLRKDIKVLHFWKTDLISYLARQLSYSFYRPRQKKVFLYPTDKSMVFFVLLSGFFVFFLFLAVFWLKSLFFALLIFVISIILRLRDALIIFQEKKDFSAFLLPFILFLRDVIILFGYSAGVILK